MQVDLLCAGRCRLTQHEFSLLARDIKTAVISCGHCTTSACLYQKDRPAVDSLTLTACSFQPNSSC